MNAELTWLKGKSLANVGKKDFSWVFSFMQGGFIATETFWRLVDSERLVIASGDHDQLFGLKEPVDAVRRVMATIGTNKIVGYLCSEVCSDLILSFEGNKQLHFFNTSAGYESWRAEHAGIQIVSIGGGKISKLDI
jgi:hypothetical protein